MKRLFLLPIILVAITWRISTLHPQAHCTYKYGFWLELGESTFVHARWVDPDTMLVSPQIHIGRYATFKRKME